MAVQKKYLEQMPFVGTEVMKAHLDVEADSRRTSIARVIRDMVDERYLLHDGEELSLREKADLAQQIATRAARRAADLAERVAALEMQEGGVTDTSAG